MFDYQPKNRSERRRCDAVAETRHLFTRATATGGWWSPRDRLLRTRPSNGSPRTRHRRISATVCRTNSSSAGLAIAAAVWRSSAAGGRPASRIARDPCDRAARL